MPKSTTLIPSTILLDLLSHLIRMPTLTSDHATNRAALDWIEDQLRDLPLHIERFENKEVFSLVATTRGAKDPKNPRLWLVAHTDVVPGAPGSFEPQLKDDRLYGRGAYDMKFAIAVFVALCQELGDSLDQYDLGLMFTSDEEVGGFDGVKWLIEDQGYRGQAAIVPDSGGNWELELGSKGILWWELTATGQAAHSSRPWRGVNAIDEIMNFVNHLRTNLVVEPCGDPDHSHDSINLSSIQDGGAATNQVPIKATARLDIRIFPTTNPDQVSAWIEAAQKAVPSVKLDVLFSEAPYQVEADNHAVTLFSDITARVIGKVPKMSIGHGSSDARHFARRDIPTITINPTGSGPHVAKEWIDIKSLDHFYDVTRQFVEAWTKVA